MEVSYVGEGKFICVTSDAVPRRGEIIQILKTDYRVGEVFWTIDLPAGQPRRQRVTVEINAIPETTNE